MENLANIIDKLLNETGNTDFDVVTKNSKITYKKLFFALIDKESMKKASECLSKSNNFLIE